MEDIDDYSTHITVGDGLEELRIVIEVSGAAFEVLRIEPPRHWVVPLLNFISTFPQRGPATDRHPLRDYHTSVVPGNLSNEIREAVFEVANKKNRLILFEFEERPGFVERLPVYEELEDDLREGRTRSAATAVVVGEVGSRAARELDDTFPSDVAALLSLATGAEVSAPSLEFRDQEGRLVRCVHYHLSPHLTWKGIAA